MSVFPEFIDVLEDPIRITYHDHLNYIKNHRHNFLEFLFVIDGKGEEVVNDCTHLLEKNSFSLILPYQIHKVKSYETTPIKAYCVAITLETVFGDKYANQLINEMVIEELKDIYYAVCVGEDQASRTKNLLEEMFKEYTNKQQWWEIGCMTKVIDLMIIFNRVRINNGYNKESNITNQEIEKTLWKIIVYIYKHFEEDITLNQLSKEFNLAPGYISKSFVMFVGKNYKEFLTEIRLKHACVLLKSTSMKVIDIAEACGYKYYRSFVRSFEQNIGKSPR